MESVTAVDNITVDNVKIHEFYLNDGTLHNFKLPIYRVALGELIPAHERKSFRSGWHVEYYNNSGSVGFMDVVARYHKIPKHGSDWSEYETVKTLTVLVIGIEPQYRERGFARFLKQKAEQIATEWGLDVVWGDSIKNPIMVELNRKMGYTLLYRNTDSYKRLNNSK